MNKKSLPQFNRIVEGKTTLLVRESYRDQILNQQKALFGKIRQEGLYWKVSLKKGRSPILCFPIPGLSEKVMVKHYRHGGFFRKLTGDILLGNSRPLKELTILELALPKGIPVPEVVALRVEKLFGPFYRGDIAYKEIPDSSNLLEYLEKLSERPMGERISRKRAVIDSLALTIKKMHNSGIYHGDLNIKNVLIRNVEDENKVYLVDFDCSRIKENLTTGDRIRNLARLNRSCEKWKAPITNTDRLRFFLTYFRGDELLELNPKKYVRKCSRVHIGHRIYWKLFG